MMENPQYLTILNGNQIPDKIKKKLLTSCLLFPY